MPEGFTFSWLASDGNYHSATLLTPPDFEAIQRADGSWYRVPRMTGDGMSSPYSKAWYKKYLRTHGLPDYFLRPRHLSMLIDNEESEHLQVPNAPSPTLALAPPREYLHIQYPGEAFWPEPSTATYRLEMLTGGARENLVRHHPGLAVTAFPYNVLVTPQGSIELRLLDEPIDCPTFSEDDVHWLRFNEGAVVPSSCHQESTGLHPLSHANQLSNRDALIQAAINEHAVLNPMEDIPGLGELVFLSEGDWQEAQRRGYASAQEVSMARRRGDLSVGTGTNAGPLVVFRPDPEMLNPREQPSGPGAWRFLTSAGDTSNARLAAIQFGGSRGLPAYPSARQIRRLGRLFEEDGRTNLALEIDIVWVPGAEDADGEADPFLDESAESEEVEEEEDMTQSDQPASSAISLAQLLSTRLQYTNDGLLRDPANNNGVRGGTYDQTGEWAQYQTGLRRDRVVTIDRSRAWYDHPEPHKFWCYSHRGWRKWKYWQTMDWKDKSHVSALNKHREQTHKRAGWPSLRADKRPDYKLPERKFVMDYVEAAKGQRSSIPTEKLTDEFHRRFPDRPRNDTGMQSLVDRLRKEYQSHGGLASRRKRGWRQQELSQASRGVSLGSQLRVPTGGVLGPLFDERVESEEPENGGEPEQSEEPEESEAQSVEGEASEQEGDEAADDQNV